MQPSPRALAFVQGFEKLRLNAYMPTPNDKPTIGWGHTGPDVKLGLVWPRDKADQVFTDDTQWRVDRLNRLLFGVPTTQGQFDALFSFVYNVGFGDPARGIQGLETSTLLRRHKVGQFDLAAAEFPKWNKQAGKVLNGLTKRRQAERLIYLS